MKNEPVAIQDLTNDIVAYITNKLSYTESTIAQYRSAWKRVEDFMESKMVSIYSPSIGDDFIYHFIGEREYEELSGWEKAIIRCTNMLTEFLENGNIKFSRGNQFITLRGEIGQQARFYIETRKALGVSNSTIEQYKCYLRSFVRYLDESNISKIEFINKQSIINFSSQLGFRTGYGRHRMLGILRNFLRYLYDRELTVDDFSRVVPKDRYIKQPDLPSTYSQAEIVDLLNAVDRGNPKGKRDYAMLLITAKLGLRAGDVCELAFNQIQWEQNLIVLNQQKTGKRIELPLLPDIGEAIIDYLKYGRPSSNLSYIFLQALQPYDRLNHSTLHSIVCYYLRKAGIQFEQKRKHGPHALRHSLAGLLLEKKTPVPVIAEVLGHKNTESTKYYLRIDINSLKQCALEVPPVPATFYGRSGC